MSIFVYIGIAAVGVIAIFAILYAEQRDKERRREDGLSPKKYHDITDMDVTTIYTIHRK